MIRLFQSFVKITAWLIYFICFRTKIYYENKDSQSRKIKGSAIIISNHTSVYDFALLLFLFPFRTIRCLMAELLFNRKGLGLFLKLMGGVKVDRDAYNFSFLSKSLDILQKNGVVAVFPESRLPKENEQRPLEFKPSATYIAIKSGAPIIPIYTNGSYFNKKRARVIVGAPIDINQLYDDNITEKENVDKITIKLREKVIELGKQLEEKTKEKK